MVGKDDPRDRPRGEEDHVVPEILWRFAPGRFESRLDVLSERSFERRYMGGLVEEHLQRLRHPIADVGAPDRDTVTRGVRADRVPIYDDVGRDRCSGPVSPIRCLDPGNHLVLDLRQQTRD